MGRRVHGEAVMSAASTQLLVVSHDAADPTAVAQLHGSVEMDRVERTYDHRLKTRGALKRGRVDRDQPKGT